jgi:hypothetical protein
VLLDASDAAARHHALSTRSQLHHLLALGVIKVVLCELVGQTVSARLYPTQVAMVASHERLADRGQQQLIDLWTLVDTTPS